MSNIKVAPQNFEEAQSRMNGLIGQMESQLKEMTACYDSMLNHWKGAAGNVYKETATMMVEETRKNVAMLRELTRDLRSARSTMEGADKAAARSYTRTLA
ncbi:MAG: WXG100 family type VII secretion target [Clostridia bacterium]|nr:WXG100 family type VII secretion target [Clostridia bacterium]